LREKVTASVNPPLARDVEDAREVRITPAAPTPFYRTRKGVIIITVAAVAIIAAVVGGAVGGGRNIRTRNCQLLHLLLRRDPPALLRVREAPSALPSHRLHKVQVKRQVLLCPPSVPKGVQES
jgi:hypothetical protein